MVTADIVRNEIDVQNPQKGFDGVRVRAVDINSWMKNSEALKGRLKYVFIQNDRTKHNGK